MIEAVKVPEIGEGVESGVVVAVHISIGDRLAVDDTVIELETDKALVEIPSPFSGRVTEVLAREGAQIDVGEVIARLETDDRMGGDDTDGPAPVVGGDDGTSGVADAPPEAPLVRPTPRPAIDHETDPSGPPVAAAPSVRRLARELGVDIARVRGGGPGGRIRAEDINKHVRDQASDGSQTSASKPTTLPDFSRWGAVEVAEMDTVRRLTARSTAASWAAIPHVTQFDEADITGVMAFIAKQAKKVQAAGAKLSLTAVITRVCTAALARFTQFNASIDVAANQIIFKRYIHIGIAVDTPRGLLVPVIRDADQKSIVDLAIAIADLAARARDKKIKPDELEGGSFSISNQGGIGGVGFTPIVLWPQVAILGVSRSAIKPVYTGEGFEPRTILPLSLSYDHRIIDGADAARFLGWICDALEQPLTLFLE